VGVLVECGEGRRAALVVVVRWLRQWIPAWAGGLVIGGSAANIIDRAITGSVTDFISGPGDVFNLADVGVYVGIVAAVARIWRATRAGRSPSVGPARPQLTQLVDANFLAAIARSAQDLEVLYGACAAEGDLDDVIELH
jgi:hypothetical protein